MATLSSLQTQSGMPLLSTLHSLPRLHSTALHMATGSSRGDDDTSSAVDSKA